MVVCIRAQSAASQKYLGQILDSKLDCNDSIPEFLGPERKS